MSAAEQASADAPKPAPKTVAAAAATKPVWRSLPLSSQGSVVAAASTSSRAGPVYRSLAVAPPRTGEAGFGHLAGLQKPALTRGVAYQPMASTFAPSKQGAFLQKDDILISTLPKKVGGLKIQGSLLTRANPVPIIFHRSAKHFEVGAGTSVSQISDMLAAVAASQGARIKANERKGSVKLTKLAPPNAPDGGCSDCVCKLHVYRQRDGSHLVDWTHREGSRTVAADLYRHVLARLKDSITSPKLDQLLVGGAPRPCRVYTVPALPRTSSATAGAGASAGAAAPAPAEPAVAAAAVEPLLASAASPCVDQQLAACQLLARLTAAGREDYMAASIVGALYDIKARSAVVSLFACLAAESGGEPGLREDVRRCIVSTIANMALRRQADAAALLALLAEAKALGAVRDALPGGAKEVDPATFASEAAREALKLAVGDA